MSEHAPQPSPAAPSSAPRGSTLKTISIVSVMFLVLAGAMIATLFVIAPGANGVNAAVDLPVRGNPVLGKQVAMARGCFTCHTDDGTSGRGPTYKGLWGSTVTYTDGTVGIIDDAEIRDALAHPAAKVMEGYEPLMPVTKLNEEDMTNLIAYLRSIGKKR